MPSSKGVEAMFDEMFSRMIRCSIRERWGRWLLSRGGEKRAILIYSTSRNMKLGYDNVRPNCSRCRWRVLFLVSSWREVKLLAEMITNEIFRRNDGRFVLGIMNDVREVAPDARSNRSDERHDDSSAVVPSDPTLDRNGNRSPFILSTSNDTYLIIFSKHCLCWSFFFSWRCSWTLNDR